MTNNNTIQTNTVQPKPRMRQVGLFEFVQLIILVMPIEATIGAVHALGGGVLRYVIAMLMGTVLSVPIVYVESKSGQAIWRRFGKDRSEKTMNRVAKALFGFQLFWIAVGLVTGSGLGKLIVHQIAR